MILSMPTELYPPKPEQRTILLVEDEAIIALDQKETLESFGYAVRCAYSGEEAVEIIRSGVPIDLVLMDIDLGAGISGDRAAQEILELRHLPIIFLSSHSSREFVDRVKQITRYGYVVKNSGEFVLRGTIEMALELFEARRRLENFFDVNPGLLCLAGFDERFVQVNHAWQEVLGYAPEEMAGASFYDFVHPDDVGQTKECLRRLATGEEIVNCLNRYRRANGSYRYMEWQAKASGNLIYAAAKDVTDRKRIEDIRREAVDEFRTIFDGTQLAMFLVEVSEDGSFSYLRTNRFHQELSGWSLEDVKGRNPVDVAGEEQGAKILRHYRRCIETERPISYQAHLETNGMVAHTTISPVIRDGKVRHLVGWSVMYKGDAKHDAEARNWLPLGC